MAKDDEDMSNLTSIQVSSDVFDVFVRVNPDVSEVVGVMRCKVFGYAKTSKTHTNFVMEYDENNQTAIFSSQQPKGWLNKSGSYIEIAIPKSLAESGFDLTINSNKADVFVGNDIDCVINNLNVKSSKGNTTIANIDFNNSINANIGSGWIYVDNSCTTTMEISSNINLGSGTVNFSKINKDTFTLGTVEIESIKQGRIGIIKLHELKTNGNIKGGGQIRIVEVNNVNFSSLDTDLKIAKINGVVGENLTSSIINISGQGDVWIGESICNLEVEGHNGDIYVKNAKGLLNLFTNKGDIDIDEATILVSVVTNSGKVNIDFSDGALNYDEESINNNDLNRKVIATIKNGRIKVRGLQNAYIMATFGGNVSLEYDKVVGTNQISTQSGMVNIVVPNPTSSSVDNEFAFNLSVNSEVNSDIKVGVVGSIGAVDYSGSGSKSFTNIYNSGSSTSNNLNVSSSVGVIKIRSADLIKF